MPEIVSPLERIPQVPLCVCIPSPQPAVCIEFPVVGEICSHRSTFRHQPFSSVMLSFMGTLQPLLAPLMPILTIISLVIALVDCVKSIPKAISRLSPGPVIDCIDRLVEILPQLTSFIPPLNYIALVRSIIFFMINLLQAIIDELTAILTLNVNPGLMVNQQYICCLDANVQAKINQFAAAISPTGPLFKIVAELLKVLAIPGTEKYVQPLIDGAELLAGASTSNVAPDLVDTLRTMQNTLVAVHDVLGGILGTVQTVANCNC